MPWDLHFRLTVQWTSTIVAQNVALFYLVVQFRQDLRVVRFTVYLVFHEILTRLFLCICEKFPYECILNTKKYMYIYIYMSRWCFQILYQNNFHQISLLRLRSSKFYNSLLVDSPILLVNKLPCKKAQPVDHQTKEYQKQ